MRKNEDTIVKQAFRTSLKLHCNGKNSFYYNIMKISDYYDLPDFDPNNLSEAKRQTLYRYRYNKTKIYCILATNNPSF